MRMDRLGISLLLVLTLCGCGGAGTPASPTPIVSGRWQGTIESPGDGAGTIEIELTQTGFDVTGTVRLTQNGFVDVPATLSGRLSNAATMTTAQVTVTYQYGEQCHGTFSGAFTVSGGQIQGPYAGQDCAHAFSGVLRAVRTD
jgi:hypothetical protein